MHARYCVRSLLTEFIVINCHINASVRTSSSTFIRSIDWWQHWPWQQLLSLITALRWAKLLKVFQWKRSLKADSHIACRAHAVPMPCPCLAHAVPLPYRDAKGLECVFPIWFTQCAVSDSHLSCHVHAAPMPFSDHAVLLKITAQHGSRKTACGLPARFRLLPATTRSSTKIVIRSIPILLTTIHTYDCKQW